MYKLLIADDESEIRNGLSQYFPWNEIGFEVVGLTVNGLETLDFISNHAVDILLCDIKMPVMGGLDVAKELYEQRSKVNMVMLSGYREFELAQMALNFGVKHYLLKPTKYTELTRVFERLKEDLDQERNLAREGEETGDSGQQAVSEKTIDKVKAYIDEHYKEASLENAAKIAYMNPYYLSRYFKQKTGKNFSEYLMEIRMEKAAELLKDESYKTYEVSEIIGYSNAKNFTRTFRRHFGKTPRDYRNEN
ncbi:putative response regulatory protein [compost metagenome]|uniref:response regulator transcription factor n=1 Tax=Paenibacillus TaxID=44249 RepID=UPI000FA678D1|nr:MULTISPECIES: helix-turn-helix domain-containing protein [Paenibacillus]MBY9078126.1 response regulator [Paenibacillus sp. CGMCC 1.18879]MBY9083867.1 response regulator [Paenibacillus sinensis]